jgi:hypothetical protein
MLGLLASAPERPRDGKLEAVTSFGCWGRRGARGSDLEMREGGGRDGMERGLGFLGCPRVGDKEEEAHASCVGAGGQRELSAHALLVRRKTTRK